MCLSREPASQALVITQNLAFRKCIKTEGAFLFFFFCLVFLFVLTGDFILQSSFRFIDKLSRKYREFLQTLSPYTRSFLFLLSDTAWNNGEGLNSPVQGCEFKS